MNLRAEWDKRRNPPQVDDDRACDPEVASKPFTRAEIVELRKRMYERDDVVVQRLGPTGTMRVY